MNNVNINDLMTLLAAVDIAVKRGTYSILEVRQVGEVAEKLNAFLGEATAAAAAAAEATATEQAAAEGQAPTATPEAPAEQA
jgi:hypothetical protein